MSADFDDFGCPVKGPSTDKLREEERKKKLASKGKVDRTEEVKFAIEFLKSITPEEVNVGELQDIIIDDRFDFADKIKEIRKYCDKNNIPTNEFGQDQSTKKNGKKSVSLQDMPAGDARTELAVNIYADELEKTARIFKKKADDARNRHYFPTDPQEQNEMILGAKAWNLYLEPMVNDKFTGDWVDLLDHLVEQARKDNKDWTENPYFIREIKYKIFSDGTTASKYEFENNSILGSSIFDRIRDIIFISDCLPFMRKAWINENKTRFRMIRERKSKLFTKRKGPKEAGDMKAKIRQTAMELNDEDEYDPDLSHIHGDPYRRPPDSLMHLNNIKEEWDAIPEAFRLNLMNKDDPEDHTKYISAVKDYWKVIGKDEQFIQCELDELRKQGIKFKDNT